MSQSRHGIKALGLALIAALGLMAFMAAGAQAEGKFTLNGVAITENESIEGTVAAGKLLVPGLGVNFLCTGGTVSGTILTDGTAHAGVLYTGCTIEGAGKFCKVFETKAKMEANAEAGSIAASGLGLLRLMNGKHYLLVESPSFAVLYVTSAANGCALPLEAAVNGSTVFELPTALSALVEQTLKTIPQIGFEGLEELWTADVLKYGNQPSWLDEGTATVKLSGKNKGGQWGAQ